MTEGKFKINFPKSIAISQISSFSVEEDEASESKEFPNNLLESSNKGS
jgi:hypothetical protein